MAILTILVLTLFGAPDVGVEEKPYALLSMELVEAVRYDRPYQYMLDSLEQVPFEVLVEELDNDQARLAFWINIYNAYIQITLNNNPEEFEKRPGFFKEERFVVAGEMLSFEEVEHGIIRHSQIGAGLGIIPKLFPPKYERKMRVKEVDPRIHFALNCGAKSCPAVAAYDYRKVDAQLDKISRSYLSKNAEYKEEEGVVYVPKLLQWFSGDFGICKKKKLKFLAKYDVLPKGVKADIKYNDYDWTLYLNNYTDL